MYCLYCDNRFWLCTQTSSYRLCHRLFICPPSKRNPSPKYYTHTHTQIYYIYIVMCEMKRWRNKTGKPNRIGKYVCVECRVCMHILRLRKSNTPFLCDNDPMALGKVQHIVVAAFSYSIWVECYTMNIEHCTRFYTYEKSRVKFRIFIHDNDTRANQAPSPIHLIPKHKNPYQTLNIVYSVNFDD